MSKIKEYAAVTFTCFLLGYFFVSVLVNKLADHTDYVSESVEIIALQDTTDIKGNSFLFSGSINENPAYWYYAKSDGYIKLESLNANLVLIDYTTGTPRIDTYNKRFVPDWLNKVFIPTDSYAKVIKIPKGSIVEEFNLDLEK